MKSIIGTFRCPLTCLLTLVLMTVADSQVFGQSNCTDDCTDASPWQMAPAPPFAAVESFESLAPPEIDLDGFVQRSAPTPLVQPQTQQLASSQFAGRSTNLVTNSSNIPGYIEWAAPSNQFRLRYDSMFSNSFPDRAEFFYPRRGGPGPSPAPTRVDLKEVRAYSEFKVEGNLSFFTDIPVRWLEAANLSTVGLGDIEAGTKYAFVNEDDRTATFMLRTYFPSGLGIDGLGTGHFSIEPGILFQQSVGPETVVFGELRDWISLGGTNFAGNVLRYGIGVAHELVEHDSWTMSPIMEAVGFSVLSGLQTNPVTLAAESGKTTILNLKVGLRFNVRKNRGKETNSLYVGFGHAVTSDEWYQQILRIDYTMLY